MPITLTTDPILSTDDVRALIDEQNPEMAKLLINAVSLEFLKFTNRTRITSAVSLVEWVKGINSQYLFLHATPITTITSVQRYSLGVLQETYASTDYMIALNSTALLKYSSTWEGNSESEEPNIKVTYTGGFTAVPGDVIRGAIEQMRYERLRMAGRVGIENVSAGGESVNYETGGLLKGVREIWAPYRVVV